MQLGKLKEIDIRKVWQHEQYDFSKWLSSENNLKELGDILNLSGIVNISSVPKYTKFI